MKFVYPEYHMVKNGYLSNCQICNSKNNTRQNSKFLESKSLRLDFTKAKKLFNWKNVYDIYQTIFETINWYRSFHEKPSMIKELSIQQIETYMINANKNKFLWAQ